MIIFLGVVLYLIAYVFVGGLVGTRTYDHLVSSCGRCRGGQFAVCDDHFGWAAAAGVFWPFALPLLCGIRLASRGRDDD